MTDTWEPHDDWYIAYGQNLLDIRCFCGLGPELNIPETTKDEWQEIDCLHCGRKFRVRLQVQVRKP